MKVEFYKHNICQEDRDEVNRVLHSLFLTKGPVTAAFEEKFAAFLGTNRALAVSSCTGAMILALMAMDIGEGDEVITTPMSYVATSNAILHTGATPVFVDVETDTGLIDTQNIEAAITYLSGMSDWPALMQKKTLMRYLDCNSERTFQRELARLKSQGFQGQHPVLRRYVKAEVDKALTARVLTT